MKLFIKELFFVLLISQGFHVFAQTTYPGKLPGAAVATQNAHTIRLENQVLQMTFRTGGDQIHPAVFMDKENHDTVNMHLLNWFTITLRDGRVITDKEFVLAGKPVIKAILPKATSAKYADQLHGKKVMATLLNNSIGVTVRWEAQLTDEANYIKQHWVIRTDDSLQIAQFAMLELPSLRVKQIGSVDGSPLVWKEMFFALEHPMAKNEINTKVATAYLPRRAALQPGDSVVINTVFGVTPKAQLRRAFQYYVERERAHPYRPFLHYNSWYDLSWIDRKMNETQCLDRIKLYGDSLIRARKIPMKAFLFDDGWDDNASLWEVSNAFPAGFTRMKDLAESYGAQLGLWLSPWGGYDSAKLERLKYGRIQDPPFETNENGFSLAGPVYFKRFEKVTTDFIIKDKVAIFKFDGVGAGNGASGAGVGYQQDIDALLRLIDRLRMIGPALYVSLTVGTWPSVYWLDYGDAIWRAGDDFGFAGTGSKRQQWITYRDAESFKNVVQRAPLFPLNSVMLHGICITDVGYPAPLEMDLKNISDGIWSFFASGTSLQELYINPHLLTTPMWDCLAAAARWSQDNAAILKDVHWIGGDPGKAEVYGYASWTPEKGIFSLRNPSAVAKTFNLNLRNVFELPPTASLFFQLRNVISPEDHFFNQPVSDSKPVTVTLQPYELKIFEASPVL